MNTARFFFNVGDFECIVIKDDSEAYPLSELTTDVSEEQLAQALRACGLPFEEWIADYNCLLINTGKHRVLVDVGWGRGTQRRDGKLFEHLQAEGIALQDIDVIVITHGDRDHTGGLVDANDRLTFANARHIMWSGSWRAWSEINWEELPEEVAAYRRKLIQVLQDRVELVDPEKDFLPGFQVIPSIGHRPEHIALSIFSAGEQLLHLSDAIVHPMLIDHGWHWPYHSLPEQAVQDEKRLLEWVADRNALVLGYHFPFPGLGHVVRQGEGWLWQPVAA